MAIEFKPLNMMGLRAQPGEILDRVARDGEAFIIERSGHRKACLVPISFFAPDIKPDKLSEEISILQDSGEHYRLSFTDNHEIAFTFLEMAAGNTVMLNIVLPHGYPNSKPKINATPILEGTPHRWKDGSLCIFGTMAQWNPGKDDIIVALALGRQWLKKYEIWSKHGQWPKRVETI